MSEYVVESQPVEPIEALTNAGEFPTLTDQGEMQIPHRPASELDPNVLMETAEPEPVSEIDTIRRTLEVTPDKRGKPALLDNRDGAMSGSAGRRP